jgi:hypothetical protein
MAKAKVGFVEPILALAVTKLPEGPVRWLSWLSERGPRNGKRDPIAIA